VLVEKVRAAATARIRRSLRLSERVRHRIRGAGLASSRLPKRERPPPDAGAGARVAKTAKGGLAGLVLIGTSTGGPAALDVVLPQLPPDFPWPVLVAQHLPASFTGAFANRLNRECRLEVVEVDRPILLRPGTIYIGKGDADVVVAQRAAGVTAMPVPAKAAYLWHPSVERMVASALDHFAASQLVGVMMTGMGNDGADAMKRLRLGGGRTIAEAESSAIVWGMPGELVKNGGAETVRPLEEIAATIIDMVNSHAPG
jgi:two-component system chemotaxis response regulator CheB